MILGDYKKNQQKVGHFHEKSRFSVTLDFWKILNTLKVLKSFSTLLKPKSKVNVWLVLN